MGLLSWLFGSNESKNKQNRENTERVRQQERERNLRAIGRNPDGSMISEIDNVVKTGHLSTKTGGVDTSKVENLLSQAITLYENGNIPLLQNKLYETYQLFNKPGGGRLITQYPAKDKLCEFFCYCLMYDWMHDDDIREVFAENGFYCIASYLNNEATSNQDLFAGCLDMFLLLANGRQSLIPKFGDILWKAQLNKELVFSTEDYANGADYLIRQFMFFSATVISPLVRTHHIISQELMPAYEVAKSDFEFASISPDVILRKANFIAKIIGSILNDM